MKSPRKINIPKAVSSAISLDQYDSFRRSYGFMPANASLWRALYAYDPGSAKEELERLRSRLMIDAFCKEHGEAGMTVERVEALQEGIEFILNRIGGEL